MANHGNCKSNIWYGLFKTHTSKNIISLFTPFIQLTHLPWMVSWNHVMIDWCYFKKLLKFLTNFCILVNEHLNWNTKPTKYPIQECINNTHYSSNNGTNFKCFQKCSIITKTYLLCHIIKFIGLAKSKFHQFPSPMMGNNDKWSVGELNDIQYNSITHHTSRNKLLNLQLYPFPQILCFEKIISLSDPKMAQFLMHMLNKAFMMF